MPNTNSPQLSNNAGLQLFMGIFAHEVKTQLAGVVSTCQYALQGRNSSFYLKAIAVGVQGSLQVLDNLLKAVQANSGYLHIETKPESFQLKALLQAICLAFEVESKMQEKKLTVDLHPYLDRNPITTDKLILTQVLYNLLTNALKWSYRNSTININCQYLPDAVNITVENTGNTIPPAKAALLFEPFYRLDNGYAGTGLGLYISRLYMEALGGTISVNSVHHHTTFTVTIPHHRL